MEESENAFNENLFRIIVEELPMPLFVTDLQDKIIVANKIARAMMGEDLKGKNANEFIYSQAEKKMVDERVKERIERGKEIDNYKITLENKEAGSVFVAELFVHVIDNYKIVVFKDITKEEEATKLIRYMENNLKNIQESMLPKEYSDFGVLEYAYFYLPYGMIGGDYFDVIKISGKKLVVITADISGHFSPAAMVMAIVRTLFHSKKLVSKSRKFVRFIEFLDSYLLSLKNISNYVSGTFARLDFIEGKMYYINAGHLPFIHNDKIIYPVKPQFPVGLRIPDTKTYSEEILSIKPGDRFIFFTDGLLTIPEYRDKTTGEVVEKIRDLTRKYWNYPAKEALKRIAGELNLINDLPAALKHEDDLTLSIIDIKE